MKIITSSVISITALYGSYVLGGYVLSMLIFILLCLHSTLSYHIKDNREEDFHINEERIPVIGGKRINWDEYREIPPDINNDGRIKFDRNNL
jgi:hypothetical protein